MPAARTRTRSRSKADRRDAEFVVHPFVDEGLGNSAYLVASRDSKEAAMIDPLRDVDRYLKAAKRAGVTITHALDTHLHNDFLSGCREIAALTGAEIGASAEAHVEFPHRPLQEGDRIRLDGLSFDVLSTPGHTPEHVSFLLRDADGSSPLVLFSGGALIVGGAARTDLLGHDMTEPLARHLYRTIHRKLLALPDDVVVYPTHGAGSFCAAPVVDERTTTIGLERTRNPLARAQTEDEFVARALSGLPSFPVYFTKLRPINRRGPKLLGRVPTPEPKSPAAVKEWIDRGGAVLDIRPAKDFVEGHIPGAYGIALEAPLVTWAGWLIPFGTALVLVVEGLSDLDEATRQLIRTGYDELHGHLEGGLAAWRKAGFPVERFERIRPRPLNDRLRAGDAPVVVDVRSDAEWEEGHIPGAVHIENGRLPEIDLAALASRPVVVHCRSWDRSTAGLSVLARRGLRDLALLEGGFAAWEASGLEVEHGSVGEA